MAFVLETAQVGLVLEVILLPLPLNSREDRPEPSHHAAHWVLTVRVSQPEEQRGNEREQT